jgi:hypothetical protein
MNIRVPFERLVPGRAYLIISAVKTLTPQGEWLFLKLRAEPYNVFVKIPWWATGMLDRSQVALINTERLFVHFAFYGRTLSGDPIFQIRNASIPVPTMEEMEAAGSFVL